MPFTLTALPANIFLQVVALLIFHSLFFFVLLRIRSPLGITFLIFAFAAFCYTLFSLLKNFTFDENILWWLDRLAYLSAAQAAVLWLGLVGQSKKQRYLIPLLLGGALLVTIACSLIDPLPSLKASWFIQSQPKLVFYLERGFILGLIFLSLLLVISEIKRIRKIGIIPLFFYFIIVAWALLAALVRLLEGVVVVELEILPFALSIAALAFVIYFSIFNLWNLAPLARTNLLETSDDPFFVIDRQDQIIDFNESFLSLFSLTRKDILGCGLPELAQRLAVKEDFFKPENMAKTVEWEFDGRNFEVRAFVLKKGRRKVGVIYYFHDYTKRKRYEIKLRQSILRLEKLNDLSRLLAMWLGKTDVMKVAIQTVTELLHAAFGALYFLESAGLKERARAGYKNQGQENSPDPLTPLFEEAAFEAITRAETVHYQRSPYSVLAVPLNAEILHGQPGALVFLASEETEFSDFDVSLAESVARQVAITTENTRLYREVQRTAQIDALTQIYTRGHFEELSRQNFKYALRHKEKFCVIMCDIDHFKKINDTYQHAVGDSVLRQVAERLRVNIREADILGRYGGEEFIVYLPQTERKQAMLIAQRIHQAIGQKTITTQAGELRVTASFGIAEFNPQTDTTLAKVVQRADKALYKAKNDGRNCIRFLEA